jgi:hypothetical protein
MNQFINGLARTMVETLDCPSPILEIGSYQVAGQEELAELRSFFMHKEYLGVDMRPGPGVDCIADVEALPKKKGHGGNSDSPEHIRARATFLEGFRRGSARAAAKGHVPGFLPLLLPPSQLSERLLALHSRGAEAVTVGFPKQRSSAGKVQISDPQTCGPWHSVRSTRRFCRSSISVSTRCLPNMAANR